MNRLWDMWASGELDKRDPAVSVLCDYESGVNGEGHGGFFSNNEDRLQEYHSILEKILPPDLRANFEHAYQSYGTDDEEAACEKADDYFFSNEQEILALLQNYANKMQ